MSKSFKILKKKMPVKALQQAEKKTEQLLMEMALPELRQARQISQERLAETLSIKQANVSRLERRSDMYISTLRSFIEGMGGELIIIARFPEGEIHVNQFGELRLPVKDDKSNY